MNNNLIAYNKHAYELKRGDNIVSLGYVLSSITIGFTTLISVLLEDCSYSIHAYPGEFVFDCMD